MKNILKQIDVSGFKSIERLSISLGVINVIIGANGAGKSNLISVFDFLGNLSRGRLKRYVELQGGAERFLHFGSKQTKKINLHVSIGHNEYFTRLEPNVNDDSFVITEEYCKFDESAKRFALHGKSGESGLAFVNGKYGVPQYTKAYLEDSRVYHFHDTSSQAAFKKTQSLSSDHYLEKDAANIAPFLYKLRESDNEAYQTAYKDILASIKSIAPFFHDFYLEPVGKEGIETIRLRWIHSHYDNPFGANSLSDGTARFICLAVLFLQPDELRPSAIIVDEPELGLHPAALVVLADIMKHSSNSTQIICSTQSVTLANQFDPDNFIVVDTQDGASVFHRPDKDKLSHWLDEFGVGDIWEKNLIGGRPF